MARVIGGMRWHLGELTAARENEGGGADITINVTTTPGSEIAAVEPVAVDVSEQAQDEMLTDHAEVVAAESENVFYEIKSLQRNCAGINEMAGRQLMARLSFLGAQYNIDMAEKAVLRPVAESAAWQVPSAIPANLRLAAEFAGELVKRGWTYLKQMIAKWLEKVNVFWNNYGSAASRLKREAESLLTRAGQANYGKKKNTNITDASLAKKLDIGKPKIVPAELVACVSALPAVAEGVKSAYNDAMGNTNFDKAMELLANGVAAPAAPVAGAAPDENDPSVIFNKWVLAMATNLTQQMEVKPTDKITALGRSAADAQAYKFTMMKEGAVIPGNASLILQEKVNAVQDTNGITEAATFRCGTYNIKSGRGDSLSDQLAVLTQDQITTMLSACVNTAEVLVNMANMVDKGKAKRQKLKDAVNRAADQADKAETAEAKNLTRARKLGQAMITQVDNPAHDFQGKCVAAISGVISYCKLSLAEYE